MKSKKKSIRFSVALLSLTLLLGVLVGCKADTDPTGTTGAPGTTTEPGETQSNGSLHIEGGDGVTLTYWIPMESIQAQAFSSLAEHPYYVWLKEETGVDIDFIHPTPLQSEELQSLCRVW